MITWGLDSLYDLYLLPNGLIATLVDVEAIEQSITNILKLWLGEADYNTAEGVNYNLILGNANINQNVINNNIIQQIQSIKGVSSVLESSYNIINNNLIITTKVKLDNGVIINVSNT